MSNPKINGVNVGGVVYDIGSTAVSFETHDEYLAAHQAGEIPIGATVFIKEKNQTIITANQVTYGNSNVKSTLDTHGEKIDEIEDDISQINTNKVYKPSNRQINAVTDLLHVALGDNDAEVNQPFYFSTDYGALTNLPSGVGTSAFYGWREVHCVMSLTTVTLHEMYPYYGRTWINTYDTNVGGWYGWKIVTVTS